MTKDKKNRSNKINLVKYMFLGNGIQLIIYQKFWMN